MGQYRATPSPRDRGIALAMVIAVHAAMAALLLIRHRQAEIAPFNAPPVLIDVPAERLPEPDPVKIDAKKAVAKPEGAAGKKAEPTEVVAPPTPLPTQNPAVASPVAGVGIANQSGAAAQGSGPGAGGSGTGSGGGGDGRPARWISGGLLNSDYPRDALRDRTSGTVSVRFAVLTNGRIDRCRVVRSSGSSVLDETTCRIIQQRLRFAPATDASGQPIVSEMGSDYVWGIRGR